MRKITDDITFIGTDDDNLDLFEGQYPLVAGISYNSFIIKDEKIAIVDAVDKRRITDWLANIDAALGNAVPDYLIIHHMEPDHSGGIRSLLTKYPDLKLVCTKQAAVMLGNFFEDIDFSSNTIQVSDGQTLSLGKNHELKFLTAPMVHWPEVMMTVDLNQGFLFSSDAFGSFAMSSSTNAWPAEARRYYSNIVGRFGINVQAVLKKVAMHDIKYIVPLHGPILTENLEYHLDKYDKWSRYVPETRGVLVAYASIYGGTAEAARRLASMLEEEDAGEVVLLDLCRHDVSYAVSEAWRLSGLALCSVTYDADVFPAMHHFLHHLAQKKLTGRKVVIMGNGSWAPAAAAVMTKTIEAMKGMEIVAPPISLKSRLHKADIPALREMAKALAATKDLPD